MNSVSEILEELVFQVSTLEPPALQRMPFPADFEECVPADQGLVFPTEVRNDVIQMPLEALVAEFQLPPKPQAVISLLIDLSDSMRGGTQVKKDQPLHLLLLSMHEIVSDLAAKFPYAKVRVSTFSGLNSVDHGPLQDIAAVCAQGIGDFEASGATAFYDSLCGTIDRHYEECPDGTVVFVVVTDGMDNASKASSEKAAEKVKFAETHKGSIVFLGTSKSVLAQSEDMGIKNNIEYCPAAPGLVRASTSETVSIELERLHLDLPAPDLPAPDLPSLFQDMSLDCPKPPTLQRSMTVQSPRPLRNHPLYGSLF